MHSATVRQPAAFMWKMGGGILPPRQISQTCPDNPGSALPVHKTQLSMLRLQLSLYFILKANIRKDGNTSFNLNYLLFKNTVSPY